MKPVRPVSPTRATIAIHDGSGDPRRGVPELMGAGEVCRLLGIRSSNLDATRGLPEAVPVAADPEGEPCDLMMGRVWIAAEVRELAEKRRRDREMVSDAP